MEKMSSIKFSNVVKIYDNGFEAVKSISFEIPHNSFTALLGPSGCGKSTMLRMLAGLESVTNGEISIDGKVVNDTPPKDRNIGMVFQNYALYPHLTVFENIAFPLKIKGLKKNEISEKTNRIASLLELENLLTKKPKQLSGGQRQRVALGRALVRNPKVFLFDEPLSNLDAKLRVVMRNEILKIFRSNDAAALYVTHDQVEAMTMAETIILMNEGSIAQIATPQEMYNNPENMFSASFIGSPAMNFFEGRIISEGSLRFVDNNNTFKLEVNLNSADSNQQTTLGIRPDDITISDKDSSESLFSANVFNIENLGHELLVYFEYGNELKSVRVASNSNITAGNHIGISFNNDKICLFDENQDRLR